MNNYQPFGKFVLRTPLLPLKYFTDSLYCENNSAELIKNNLFQEAIYIASQNAYNLIYNESNINKKLESEDVLSRYITRASTKPTPFGLFSGVTIGNLSNENNVKLHRNFKKEVRLDFNILNSIKNHILFDFNSLRNIIVYPNNTIHKVLDQYRYYEPYKIEENQIQYRFSTLECTSLLEEIIDLAQNGKSINDLIISLNKYDFELDEISSYFQDLLQISFLVTELELKTSGTFYFDYLKEKSGKIDQAVYQKIKKIDNNLNEISISSNFERNKYEEVKQHVSFFNANIHENVFQIDSYRDNYSSKIQKKYSWHVLKGVDILNRIISYTKNNSIENFIQKFPKKFGSKKIPILLALDPLIGINYLGSEDNLLLPKEMYKIFSAISDDDNLSVFNIHINPLVQNKIIRAAIAGLEEVEIEDDLLLSKKLELADTFSALTSFTDYTYKKNQQILLHSITGGSGTTLLSRFGFVNDDLNSYISEITKAEQTLKKNQILADISFSPSPRVGNILARPHFREFEIPILTNSDNLIKQINLNDILVSIQNGYITLESKSLQQKITPKLSTAHNYQKVNLPIYRFLCDIQDETEKANNGLLLSLDNLLNTLTYIPRIRYKNIILYPQKWNILLDPIKHKLNVSELDKKQNILKEIFTKGKLPFIFNLYDNQKQTYKAININNLHSCSYFLKYIKKTDKITISEFISYWGGIKDFLGDKYANQIIFTYFKKNGD